MSDQQREFRVIMGDISGMMINFLPEKLLKPIMPAKLVLEVNHSYVGEEILQLAAANAPDLFMKV